MSWLGVGLLTVWFWTGLPFCHSQQHWGRMTPASPIFSPDGTRVAFLGFVYVIRPPVGICTFPDGGTPLKIRQEMQVYVVPLEGGAPRLVATIPIPLRLEVPASGSYRLIGWDQDELFFWVAVVQPGPSRSWRQYYAAQMTDGIFRELPREIGPELDRRFWGFQRFAPHDQKQWVDYDDELGIIGIFTGGKWQFDAERKSVFTSGFPPTSLIRVIVDRTALEQLQPQLQ